MTVALSPFIPSIYATYGVPSEAITSEVYAASPAEGPAGPTGLHDPLTNFMTVALFWFPLSIYATYGVPSGAIASEVYGA
ncbi:hypothetical protein D1872_188940 [compost metagenome]